MQYDFIIVGSGLAGLNAALLAAQKGHVLVVTKKKLADCNTYYAQGGIAAVIDKTDSFDSHIKDTITAGAGHNNKKTVEFIVKKAPAAIHRLIRLGISFRRRPDHELLLNLEGGHSHNRIVNAGDSTGMAIENKLISKIRNNKKITVLENTLVTDLLVKKNVCYGISILKKENFTRIYGRRTIVAGGGLAQIYEKTTNPDTATGDCIAMAYRAGCILQDLEFIQFHPTALIEKKDKNAPLFLLSESLRGQGARLINHKGKYFMKDLHPLADLAPRDIVSRAIFDEQKKGPVFLDCRKIGTKIFRRDFPQISAKLESLDIDPGKNFIPIAPSAHYTCGGIKTNLEGKTNIRNLFACGETACTGMHGANRLASNSLLEAAVMSEQVAGTTLPEKSKTIPPVFTIPHYKKQASTLIIRRQIRTIMWHDVGIVRKQKSLHTALKKLAKISKNLPPPTDEQSIITRNLLTCATLVARAALARKKSLGAHYMA